MFYKAILPSLLALSASQVSAAELKVYNWSDYFGAETISQFEQQTGVKIVLHEYDSNERLDNVLRGKSESYDVVFPSDTFFAHQMHDGLYAPLNKRKIPNYYTNLDRTFLASMQADLDPGNRFGLPYMWGTTGIAYNREQIEQILGSDFEFISWKQFFDPKILKQLSACGVNYLDSPDEMIPHALLAAGYSMTSENKAEIAEAIRLIEDASPYVTFNTDDFNYALTGGETCVTMGWSGDMYEAFYESDDESRYEYVVPVEGAVLWVDMVSIPSNAPNPELAHEFLNFLMDSQVSADIVNKVAYSSAVKTAVEYINPEILANPDIYPSLEQRRALVILGVDSDEVASYKMDLWLSIRGPDWRAK